MPYDPSDPKYQVKPQKKDPVGGIIVLLVVCVFAVLGAMAFVVLAGVP